MFLDDRIVRNHLRSPFQFNNCLFDIPHLVQDPAQTISDVPVIRHEFYSLSYILQGFFQMNIIVCPGIADIVESSAVIRIFCQYCLHLDHGIFLFSDLFQKDAIVVEKINVIRI